MACFLGSRKRAFLVPVLLLGAANQLPGCGGASALDFGTGELSTGSTNAGGVSSVHENPVSGGDQATGGTRNNDDTVPVGGAPAGGAPAGGAPAGGAPAGGAPAGGAPAGGAPAGGGSNSQYTVALVQSPTSQAVDITKDEVKSMVDAAVSLGGGLDFIRIGDTVVLKPNLVKTTIGGPALAATVNGVTTDWRVTLAVAELVRAKVGSQGKILVMEGSSESTVRAFGALGYTSAHFGSTVDEFIALEGSSCDDRSTNGLAQRPSVDGKLLWVNQRYFEANWVISIAVLKTHWKAGITGAVKNLGIGATPASQYSDGGCTRTQSIDYIDHSRTGLGQFIHDYYSMRPADFAIIDGLQGLQHGPSSDVVPGGDYPTDRMNMRLILTSRNAVALDATAAVIMGCDPQAIDHLKLLEASGFGTTDQSQIDVVGNTTVAAVQEQFAGPDWACGTP